MNIGFFIQNTKRGGLDTFLINLVSCWPNKKDKIFIFYNKNHKGIIDYKKKIQRKVFYKPYNYFLSQDIVNLKSNIIYRIYIKLLRYFLLLNSIYLKPYLFLKIFSSNKIDKLLIINGGYQGGEACNSALFGWSKYKPKDLAWYSFHNYAQSDKSLFHFFENFFRNLIDKKVLYCAKGLISVSKSCLKSLKLRTKLNKTKKIVIYNGKNFSHKQNTLVCHNKNKIIVMLAVYEPRKGYEFIIKSMKIINKKNENIKLHIYGDGNPYEKKNIESIINEYGLNDIVILKKFTQDTKKVFTESDLVVIPSQRDESFGYVAIEAFFYKKPIVACAVGGLKEVIRDNLDGYLVNKKNYKVFSKKILNLLENKKLREKFTKNGFLRYQKNFTANNMSKNYYNLIKND